MSLTGTVCPMLRTTCECWKRSILHLPANVLSIVVNECGLGEDLAPADGHKVPVTRDLSR